MSIEAAPAPAVRRTYGRARAASPMEVDERTTASLFRAPPTESPVKTLLGRFTSGKTSFLNSLVRLDPSSDPTERDPSSDATEADELSDARSVPSRAFRADSEEDTDAEDLKAVYARLQREMRGEPATGATEKPVSTKLFGSSSLTALSSATLNAPQARARAFGSSTLTELSATSPLLSSPPRARALGHSSSMVEEETFPVRRTGTKASGRAKRVIASDDDDDEDGDTERTETATGDASPDDDVRSEASAAPSHLFSRESTAEPPRRRPDDLYEQLVREYQTDLRSESDKTVERSTDPVEMFDEADEPVEKAKSSKKIKALNQKDQAEMHKDIARAQRDRSAYVPKVKGKELRISEWVGMAQEAVKNPSKASLPPPLTREGTSPPETSSQQTPSDIGQFTPSSALRPVVKPGFRAKANAAQSPTPLRPGQLRLTKDRPSELVSALSDTDDELHDPQTLLRQSLSAADERAQREMRRARLAAMKQAALSAAAEAKTPRPAAPGSDDEIELVKETPVPVRPAAGRSGPSARAVLDAQGGAAAITKSRQTHLRNAGNKARRADVADTTESYMAAAARFDHPNLLTSLAGARPPGMKKGREQPLTQAQLDKTMREMHLKQAQEVERRKEDRFGKGRALPERQAIVVDDLIAETQDGAVVDEDEDTEDDDFMPDDDVVAYSGESDGEHADVDNEDVEEDGGERPEDETAEAVDAAEEDKENVPPLTLVDEADDDEDAIVPVTKPRRSKPSRHVVFESDDDEPVAAATQLANPKTVQDSPTVPALATLRGSAVDRAPSPELDLGGFGDGSQGFSQLFGETQAADASTDAFVALREQPAALLPAHMLLPDVEISKTQIERDNALIAGDGKVDFVPSAPKKQYLNTQGFFTQTRPKTFDITQTQVSDDEAGPSRRGVLDDDTLLNLRAAGRIASPTGTASHAPVSPTQATPVLRRLKRRATPPLGTSGSGAMDVDMEPDAEPTEAQPTAPSSAFEVMQRAAERQRRREERRAALRAGNELLDQQAEESDDGDMWGPIGGDDNDDEDGDEGYVPDLLNDEERTEAQRKADEERAAEKFREIEQADDARREAEARKVVDGQMRNKRRGKDFLSDDEEDSEVRKRRLTRKQRRARRLMGEDGLAKLDGENNAFKQLYEQDLESDDEVDETPMSPVRRSPELSPKNGRQRYAMLQERARMDAEAVEAEGRAFFRQLELEDDDVLVTRTVRSAVSVVETQEGAGALAVRSSESYAEFVRDETLNPRRLGGSKGVSVVGGGASGGGGGRGLNVRASGPGKDKAVGRAPLRQSSSILMAKKSGFA
ncbi:hypothetical protein Q5752_001121 [Cryptotrichosporon argae]